MDYNSAQIHFSVDSEGYLAQDALVGHHADIPDVDLVVVGLALDDLGRVVQRAARGGLPHAEAPVDCPAEITDFHHSEVEQDVLRLDISVDDQLLVDIVDTLADLPHDHCHIFLVHSPLSS